MTRSPKTSGGPGSRHAINGPDVGEALVLADLVRSAVAGTARTVYATAGRSALCAAPSDALFQACSNSHASPPPPPPPEVSVVTVVPERVALTSEWIATLDGYVNAQIRPQVTGYLLNRNYEEGAAVRKGQVLFEIDPRPFESALAQARGAARRGAGAARQGRARRGTRSPAGRTARHRAEPARQRRAGQPRRAGGGPVGHRRGRNRAAQRRIHQGHLAHRRRRRDRDRADRRSGRPVDAADHGVADRSDQGLLSAERAGVSAGGRPDQQPRRARGRGKAAAR